MKDIKINLDIESFSLEKIDNTGLTKVRMYVCHDGLNRNESIISLDTIKDAIPTLFRKPILYKYNKYIKDVMEHDDSEVPAGYIHELNNNISYEEKDGRNYLVADGILWDFYCSEVINLFERDSEKSISMEIQVLDYEEDSDKKMIIKKFRFLGITLLGNHITSGMIDTKASIVEFSKMTKKADKIIKDFSKKNKLPIDKIKELKDTKKVSNFTKEDLSKEDFEYLRKEDEQVEEKEKEVMAEVKDEEIKNKEEMGCHSENKEVMAEEETPEEEKTESPDEEKKEEDDKEDFSKTIEEFKKKIEEKDDAIFALGEKIKELEEKYNSKVFEIDELKKYKAEKEEKEKFEYTESLLSKYSKILSKEEIEVFRSKIGSCNNVREFTLEIKEYVADKVAVDSDVKNQTSFINMALVENNSTEYKSETIWETLKKS